MIEKSNEKSTNVKKKANYWKMLFILTCILISIVSIWGYVYHKSTEAKLKQNIVNEKSLVDQYRTLIEKEQNNVKTKSGELDKLKAQISGIKDKDDLLKRDIQMYIDTTHPKVPDVVAKEIAKQIVNLSRKYKVSPELVLGIIKIESAFNPMAVGPKTKYGNARGLMQVMPEWSKKLGLKSQYDFHNIKTILKGHLSEKPFEELDGMLNDMGAIPIESLKKCIYWIIIHNEVAVSKAIRQQTIIY